MNPNLPLNEPQERHITTILAHLEKAVADLRNSIGTPPAQLTLTHYEDPLPATLNKTAGPVIGELEAALARIARELGLPTTQASILRRHLAGLQLLSIDLGTVLPDSGLRGYGQVAPATAHYLEEQIPRVETLVRELVQMLERGG